MTWLANIATRALIPLLLTFGTSMLLVNATDRLVTPPPPTPTPRVIFVPVEPVPSPSRGVPSPTPRQSPSPSPSPAPCVDAVTTSLPPPSVTPRPTPTPPTLQTPPPAGCATTAAALAIALGQTTTCANGVDNTGGLGMICEVTVLNTITAVGGSSIVTVRECHGAAGAPRASCATQSSVLSSPVTSVNQCNGSANGGGSTLRCSVAVTNTFSGVTQAATAASVNQCNGSGGGITSGCKPFPASAAGATITQCNGSANGGTLVGLLCTASGTTAPALTVSINQCNDSANGGGSLVICTANLVNNQVVATPKPSIPPLPNSSVASPSDPLLLGGLLLVALSMLALLRRVL